MGVSGEFMYFGMSSPMARPPNAITFPDFIRDRKHDAAAESVVKPPALIARKKPGDFEQFFGIFRFQLPQQRVARGGSKAKAEAHHRFAIEAAIFQIRRRDFSFRAFMELPRKKCRRFAMHFDQRGALLILAALFGRTLARLGNRECRIFRRRCEPPPGNVRLLQFHHKFENVAAHAAAEAMVNLPHGMHGEGRRLFLMERTQAGEILPGLFQADVFADHADDVRLLLYSLRE